MPIDIREELIKINELGLLDKLLKDKTTNKNIIWATDAYNYSDENFDIQNEKDNQITIADITGSYHALIDNRAKKELERQAKRTKAHAEVFTPLWICQMMNDYADEIWFEKRDAFFIGENPTEKVEFPSGKSWQEYVDTRRLEITCGEAPYLVSRYDISTGEKIELKNRVGILDRKLRVVSENAKDKEEWLKWAKRAFEATYGYEFQGDSLLIARLNLLKTFEDYYNDKGWKENLTTKDYSEIINIITWNIWQMDGLTGKIPKFNEEKTEQQSMLQPNKENFEEKTENSCKIRNWRKNKNYEFSSINKGGTEYMKFDFIIGNPPYQDETLGDNSTFAPPIYHKFLDGAYELADRVEMIHPARFLFNAGSTPKRVESKNVNR